MWSTNQEYPSDHHVEKVGPFVAKEDFQGNPVFRTMRSEISRVIVLQPSLILTPHNNSQLESPERVVLNKIMSLQPTGPT